MLLRRVLDLFCLKCKGCRFKPQQWVIVYPQSNGVREFVWMITSLAQIQQLKPLQVTFDGK